MWMAIFNGCSSNLISTLIYPCFPAHRARAGRQIWAQQGLNDGIVSHKKLREQLLSLSLVIRGDKRKGQQQSCPCVPVSHPSGANPRDLGARSQPGTQKAKFSGRADLTPRKTHPNCHMPHKQNTPCFLQALSHLPSEPIPTLGTGTEFPTLPIPPAGHF